MIKIRSLSVILAVVVSLAGAAAHAAGTGLFRAYLSKSGIDTNPCTLPQPCRLLPAALAVTADGGEIWILDSANYNTSTVNIAQSVTILAIPGVVGSVVASGADAIDVASGASLALRNLVIGPLPGAGGLSGIQVSSGSTLVVEDCLIANLATAGITANSPARIAVLRSTIRGNGDGIDVSTLAGATTQIEIADSTLSANSNMAISLGGSGSSTVLTGAIVNNRVFHNGFHAIVVNASAGGVTKITASGNAITDNGGDGIAGLGSGSTIWASGNTVSGNLFGFVNSGVFESASNNYVRNNGSDTFGTALLAVGPI